MTKEIDAKLREIHDSLWVNPEAQEFIELLLTSTMTVFEYGSGGSTVYFAKRVQHVVSVEHCEDWVHRVKQELRKQNLSNYELLFVPPKPGELGQDPADPSHYYSDDRPVFNFRAYASTIDCYPDGHFDLVMVDGRARPSCLYHAHSKVKVGRYLILDDADRGYYLKRTAHLFKSWQEHRLPGHKPSTGKDCTTAIWQKR